MVFFNKETEMPYKTPTAAIIHELLDDEVIIANLDSGVYYSIRESGVPIWQLLLSGYDTESILKVFQQTYLTDISAPLDIFIAQLVSEGLLAFSENQNLAPIQPRLAAVFNPPVFEKYEEMKTLLMLDPIHEVDEQGWPCKSAEMESGPH